jgi:simple sugar transport system ATP-binding protein
MDDILLEVRDIHKSFGGVHAVKGVSFKIRRGEVVAIVGDNGAGKSTLIKMISGAYKRDHGEIFWQGRPVQINSPEDSRQLGIETMYQELALVGDVDAAGNIFLGREPMTRLLGFIPVLDRKTMRRQSQKLLERIKIRIPNLDLPVRQLSGGQRQATAIARFLLSENASCIIMDEPTASLGVQESRKVTDLIRQLKAENITVIVISHNLEHVFSVSDRIMVLRNGQLAGVRDTNASTKQEIVSLIMGAEA